MSFCLYALHGIARRNLECATDDGEEGNDEGEEGCCGQYPPRHRNLIDEVAEIVTHCLDTQGDRDDD